MYSKFKGQALANKSFDNSPKDDKAALHAAMHHKKRTVLLAGNAEARRCDWIKTLNRSEFAKRSTMGRIPLIHADLHDFRPDR